MITKPHLTNRLRRFLSILVSSLLFCSFSMKGIQCSSADAPGMIRDTVPAAELRSIKWNDAKYQVVADGGLLVRLNNGDSVLVARKDYEDYARAVSATRLAFDQPFTKVEIEPAFPGGSIAWSNYLQKNLH
jgi:hypothetical protein